MNPSPETLWDAYRARLITALNHYLPSANDQEPLCQAMRYAVLNPGKRLRPLLMYACGDYLGLDLARMDQAACAVELIHAYSLVHDDLPAMDDDDLRRGLPTCHKAFGEALAILTGDVLQSLAFEILTVEEEYAIIPAATRLAMIRSLALACGLQGMAGGQALDLSATGQSISIAEVEQIHRSKTGALIETCIRLALLVAECRDPHIIEALEVFGKNLGLAFQIQDDLLDLEVETATLGKPQGSDQAKGKATYPAVLGITGAKQVLHDVYQSTLGALARLPSNGGRLFDLTQSIMGRSQ